MNEIGDLILKNDNKNIRKKYKKELKVMFDKITNYKEKEIKKIVSLIMRDRGRYIRHTRLSIEDIQSEIKVIILESLERLEDKSYYVLLNYLDKILYNRLQDRSDLIALSEEDLNFNYNNNLGALEAPIEEIDNYFIEEDFSNYALKNVVLDKNYYKFSKREKEVLELLREGYDHGYIADELNMSYQHIYNAKKRIFEKIN